jgi:hypothetical protein
MREIVGAKVQTHFLASPEASHMQVRANVGTLSLLLFTAACHAGTAHSSAGPQPASAAATADGVIAQWYSAIGGYDRLEAVRTRRMRGVYDEGSLHTTTDIAWRRPALRRVNVHAPGFEYSEGFDGSTWELNHNTGKLVRDTGAAADAGRRGAEFDESFVDYRSKGHTVEFLGTAQIQGADAYHLRVTLSDGWQKEYYFDRTTHLIRFMRKAMPIHAVGPVVESLISYEDWRDVGGLLIPHRFVEHAAGTSALLNALQWSSIEDNVDIPDSELLPGPVKSLPVMPAAVGHVASPLASTKGVVIR